MDNPSLEVIGEIKKRLPDGVSLIEFFMEVVALRKEAAYRRLRGEIPLSLVEVKKIAVALNLSLDELFRVKKEGTYTSSIVRMNGGNLIDAYCKTIENIVSSMKFVRTDPHAFLYSAINILPNSHLFKYPVISKFRLFKWVYQSHKTPNPLKMSEIEISPRVRYLEENFLVELQQIATHFVFIRELFGPFFSDIQYFMEIGLLTKDELDLLKEETYCLLDDLERDISVGETIYGAPLFVYLSNTYFDSNYIYVEGNGFKASSLNVFGMNYLSSVENEICNDTKDWIESLMKYSTLISKSGEVERMHFFNLQREMLSQSKLKNLFDTYLQSVRL